MKFKHLTIITFNFYEAEIPRFRFKSARTELPFSPRGSSQPFRAPRSPLGACCDITVSPGRALTSQAHTEPRNCDLTAAGSHGGAREGGGDAPLTCAGTPPPLPAPGTQLPRGGLARVARLGARGPADARPRGQAARTAPGRTRRLHPRARRPAVPAPNARPRRGEQREPPRCPPAARPRPRPAHLCSCPAGAWPGAAAARCGGGRPDSLPETEADRELSAARRSPTLAPKPICLAKPA